LGQLLLGLALSLFRGGGEEVKGWLRARMRTHRKGQIDPIWLIVAVGIALVLAFAVWKFVIPPIESGITNTGQCINSLNSQMGSAQSGSSVSGCPQ